jgi:hypothetical protein
MTNAEMLKATSGRDTEDDIDLVIRVVPKCGYLPVLFVNEREFSRGEFQDSPETALAKLNIMMVAALKHD